MSWGVPGLPLLRNRRPLGSLGGTKLLQMICYMKYLPDPIIMSDEVFTIILIIMHTPIFALYVGPTKVKEIKLKTLNHLILCFFIHLT